MRHSYLLTSPLPFVVDPESVMRSSGRQIDWDRVPETFRIGGLTTVTVGVGGAAGAAISVPVTGVTVNIPVGETLDFGGGKFARVRSPYTVNDANLLVDALPTALVAGDVATYGRTGPKRIAAGTAVADTGAGLVAPRSGMLATMDVASAAHAGNTGNGVLTLANPKFGANVIPDVYRVVFVEAVANLGTFEVVDPNGDLVGVGKVGVAFANQVNFTIADGSVDFVAGDSFDLTATFSANPKAIGLLETECEEPYTIYGHGDYSAAKSGYGVMLGGIFYENLLPDATGNPAVLPAAIKDELKASGYAWAFEQYNDNRTVQ